MRDELMNRWMDDWVDGLEDLYVIECMVAWVYGSMDGCLIGRMFGWVDG